MFMGQLSPLSTQYTGLPEHKGFTAVHCATKARTQTALAPKPRPAGRLLLLEKLAF